MAAQVGLPVVWLDQNGTQFPAIVQAVVDDSHADLAVFIKSDGGFRNDQLNVPYAATPTAGCYSFITST